jgi:hypothetical protein
MIYEKTDVPKPYTEGNLWQKKVYKHMADFLQSIYEVKVFGQSANGNRYKHLLTVEQAQFNFITEDIYSATIERFKKHKAGDLNRILTNTAASQPYCFNLFLYLNHKKLIMDHLFSDLLNKSIKVQHVEPEFTPNLCDNVVGFPRASDESLGDQDLQKGIGTDADVAIFYTYDINKKGVLLIEFKFIESEFSVCSSFANKEKIHNTCNSVLYYSDYVESKNHLCGYNKYFNWDLTKRSKVFDNQKLREATACPFRFGLNQLWRNMLLAEKVAGARNCDEFGFWVFSPQENNKYLWKKGETESQIRTIMTEMGNRSFRNVTLETILDKLEFLVVTESDRNWLMKMNEKYRII